MKAKRKLLRAIKDIGFVLFLFSPVFLPAIVERALEVAGV